MNYISILNDHRYQIIEQLGNNKEGGRITWKGIELSTQKTVVIKQFCFAKAESNWSGYKAYERELKILQELNHIGIPKYLSSIETKDGFCLIQQYIPASSLDNYRELTLLEVQKIGIKVLEILVYLQNQNPAILHRDIKPANILLDEDFNLYLIDFGLASFGDRELSGSSVFKGTPGFIAPEQIIRATPASDLYSLGVTLVCLLSDKSIVEIQELTSIDNPYQLNIKALFPQLNQQFVNWLEKMTNPKASKRFSDALTAKEALLSIDLESDSSDVAVLNLDSKLNPMANSKITLGTLAIASLSATTVWGIKFIDSHVAVTLSDIAIAIIATIVIAVTQLGAIEIAKTEPEARLQGSILGIGVPILLTITSSFIWGIGEAVDISATVSLAELFIFTYFWWHVSSLKQQSITIKSTLLLLAIALGTTLGIKLL